MFTWTVFINELCVSWEYELILIKQINGCDVRGNSVHNSGIQSLVIAVIKPIILHFTNITSECM